MEIYAHRISEHAVTRFRERVRNVPEARDEMLCCLASAKPNILRRIDNKKKRTTIVKTGCCFFVFSHGNLVTTLKELGSRGKE